MKRKEAFNMLFTNGFEYDAYKSRSDKHRERMERAWKSSESFLSDLNDDDFNRINQPIKILIIGENWCGDCAKAVPSIAKLADKFDKWELKISPKDDITDETIIDHYNTSGKLKIPVVIFSDLDGNEINRWVERPTVNYRKLAEIKGMNLPKEDHISTIKSTPELKTENTAIEVVKEILWLADRTVSLIELLPRKE